MPKKKIKQHSLTNTYFKSRWFHETNYTFPQLDQWPCDNTVCVCNQGNQARTTPSSHKPGHNRLVVITNCRDKNLQQNKIDFSN